MVVGGGISGLAAALAFQKRNPKLTCLVLENHPVFGGEAAGEALKPGDAPWLDPRRPPDERGGSDCASARDRLSDEPGQRDMA